MICLRTNGRRAAWTLIEMLVVIAGLGVCMAIGVGLLVTVLKADKIGEAVATRVSHRQELARTFRDDVARAEGVSDKLGDLVAGPTHLILRKPGGTTVAYRWANKTLGRIERIGTKETRRIVPVGAESMEVEFFRGPDNSNIITLRITEKPAGSIAKRTEISAALGGDMR